MYKFSSIFSPLDDEKATLTFSSNPVSNQCLNLMQKTNEYYHSKRTTFSALCGFNYLTNLESMPLKEYLSGPDAWQSIQNQSQVGITGCRPKATGQCKKVALNYAKTLDDIFNDKDLPTCFNTSMIFDQHGQRENDFFILTKQYSIETPPVGGNLNFSQIIDDFKSSCQ